MIEHNCDECGSETVDHCLCEKDLDKIRDEVFQDGKVEGFDEGYNRAKEELSTNN